MELQASHDTEIEGLRSDLKIAAFEHETRFARLHERRAEVIAELYVRLVKAQSAFHSLTDPLQLAGEPQINEKLKAAAECGNAFKHYYNENRIYFDEPLCKDIESVISMLDNAWININLFPGEPWTDLNPRIAVEKTKMWTNAWKTISEHVPPLRQQIESRFREMLGVKDGHT